MANTIALKRRITSVKNTKQITKAMELVSASKMRRAQEQAVKTRDYSHLAREILTRLRELTDVSNHPLFQIKTPDSGPANSTVSLESPLMIACALPAMLSGGASHCDGGLLWIWALQANGPWCAAPARGWGGVAPRPWCAKG